MTFPFRRTPKEFKRQPEGRKKEAEKARKKHVTSEDFQNIKNKLGLSQRAKEEKVISELKRISRKSARTARALGITKEDYAKFGIKI